MIIGISFVIFGKFYSNVVKILIESYVALCTTQEVALQLLFSIFGEEKNYRKN